MAELRLAGSDTRTLKEILTSINEVAVTLNYMQCRAIQEDIAEIAKRFAAGGWISVDDALPEQGKRYLVIRYDFVTKTPFVDILWHDAHDLWWNRLYKGNFSVTHWMPLPEPPEVKE